MGKGDMKTKRGKIIRGSSGVSRQKKKTKVKVVEVKPATAKKTTAKKTTAKKSTNK